MKRSLSTRGYIRAVLLSVCAAVIIEGLVNADEVRAAFMKGKELKNAAVVINDSGHDILRIPQNISGMLGTFYYSLFS